MFIHSVAPERVELSAAALLVLARQLLEALPLQFLVLFVLLLHGFVGTAHLPPPEGRTALVGMARFVISTAAMVHLVEGLEFLQVVGQDLVWSFSDRLRCNLVMKLYSLNTGSLNS